MDLDFLAARVQSSKHRLSAVQAAGLNNSGEEDIRAWFPCPFCYVEIEVPVLCSHLQEEHCFDLKNAVCPICAATLGKDVIGHFTMQHAHSVKRRRKSQKSGMLGNTSAAIGKDLRELTSFLGSNSLNCRSDKQEPTPDPVLSPFLCSIPFSNPKGYKGDVSSGYTDSMARAESYESQTLVIGLGEREPSLSDAVEEQDYEEWMKRASFSQELIISTIF